MLPNPRRVGFSAALVCRRRDGLRGERPAPSPSSCNVGRLDTMPSPRCSRTQVPPSAPAASVTTKPWAILRCRCRVGRTPPERPVAEGSAGTQVLLRELKKGARRARWSQAVPDTTQGGGRQDWALAGPAKDSTQRGQANVCALVVPPAERRQAGGRRWAQRGQLPSGWAAREGRSQLRSW